jgi:hypothetical protein
MFSHRHLLLDTLALGPEKPAATDTKQAGLDARRFPQAHLLRTFQAIHNALAKRNGNRVAASAPVSFPKQKNRPIHMDRLHFF